MREKSHLKPYVLRFAPLGAKVVLAIGLILSAMPSPSVAQLPTPEGNVESVTEKQADDPRQLLERLEQHGDLTLRNATLEGALFTISDLWGINIVAAKVEGEVNGVFKDAPLREILDSILLSNGYAYRPVGKSLVVSRTQELGKVNPFFVSETISIGAAEVNEIVEAARLMSTPNGQIRPLPSAGAVLVVDFPDRVERIRKLIQQIDESTRSKASKAPIVAAGPVPQQLEVAYFHSHFVPASELSSAIDVILSPVGRISVIESEDRFLVVDYAENIRMVESVLAKIDRPRPQVNIKALIYDISLSDIEEIGVNWNGVTDGNVTGGVISGGSGLLANTVTKQPFAATSEGGSFTFFTMNNNLNLQAVVLALQKAEDSRLLADPNVTVLDKETANIESVSEIPYQQLTQTSAGGNIGTTAFKQAGIKLKVIPKISQDGTIDLTVSPEFSRLAGFTPGDNQPIIDIRSASTRVRVQNGQTMMIAGLRQRNDVGGFSGIPFLKDFRYFGHLFRSHDTQIRESELVVFITPEIVGFRDPLSPRDQLTSDTVHCRLDHIPAAEGCPPNAACGACGPHAPHHCGSSGPAVDGTIYQGDSAAPTEQYSPPVENSIVPIEQHIAPQGYDISPQDVMPPLPTASPGYINEGPLNEGPVDELPPVEEILPQSASRSNFNPPRQPAKGRIRRLPPVGSEVSGIMAGNRVAIPTTERLRPDYDSRFRAAGGVYSNQQRMAERPSLPTAGGPPQPAAKKSWIDRVLLR